MTNSKKSDTEIDTDEQGVERPEDVEKKSFDGEDDNSLAEMEVEGSGQQDAVDASVEEPELPESDEIIDAELEMIVDEEETVSDDAQDDDLGEDRTAEDTDPLETQEDPVDDALQEGEEALVETEEHLEDTAESSVGDQTSTEDAEALEDAESADTESPDTDAADADPESTERGEDEVSPDELADDALVAREQEPTEEPVSDLFDEKPQPQTQPQPEPRVEVVKGSMWPGIFGGVVAALVGFIVGRGDAIDSILPASLQRAEVTFDTSALEAADEALTAQTDALATQTADLASQAADLAAQSQAQAARIDALEVASGAEGTDAVDGIAAEITALAERLTALENKPAEIPEELADAASTADVDALQSALDAQKSQIADLAERAEAAEAAAAGEAARLLAQAALMRVMTAVDSGESFSPALNELEEVTPVAVPSALQTAAETGVPTLTALQADFPEAARAGLAAARAEIPESEVTGIGGFLKRQLNVRSVTPREGSDPDAVLSRAQAAVDAGDLGTALSETDTLPDAAKTAMTDWLEAASARKAAQDAAQELADSLNSN